MGGDEWMGINIVWKMIVWEINRWELTWGGSNPLDIDRVGIDLEWKLAGWEITEWVLTARELT